jgi:hypothetical protein
VKRNNNGKLRHDKFIISSQGGSGSLISRYQARLLGSLAAVSSPSA